jgi:hypothetical protein
MAKWIATISTILLIATNALWAYVGFNSLVDSSGLEQLHQTTRTKLERLESLNDRLLESISDDQVIDVFNNLKSEYSVYREENPYLGITFKSAEYDTETNTIKVVLSCE